MSARTESGKQVLPDAIARQAIAYRIRMESGAISDLEMQACRQWREAAPENEVAWQRLVQLESTFDRVADQAPSLARTTLQQADVECQRMNRRQVLRAMGSSALGVAAVGWVAHDQGMVDRLKADYYTVNGERSQFTLQDNSQVWLNSDSAIQLNYGRDLRRVKLTRGEIHLDAAIDSRPMRVTTSHGSLTATDSKFIFRYAEDQTVLQVIEGHVQLQQHKHSRKTDVLAGQAYSMNRSHIRELDARMFDYSGWVDGFFSVRNMPLKDLLAELSRYRSGFLRCDPQLENYRVSGVYQLNDTDLILQTLARSAQAEVRYLTRWWAQIQPASLA